MQIRKKKWLQLFIITEYDNNKLASFVSWRVSCDAVIKIYAVCKKKKKKQQQQQQPPKNQIVNFVIKTASLKRNKNEDQ